MSYELETQTKFSDETLHSKVLFRFKDYVEIDTSSDPRSNTIPSTEKQKNLGRKLVEELTAIGIPDAKMDEYGYVFGTLEAHPTDYSGPTVGLLAHMDTSPDESGEHVVCLCHPNYQGGRMQLSTGIYLDPDIDPELLNHIGEDILTTDGTTLLGSDDKAGIAIIMQVLEDLIVNDGPRPKIRVCFTIDEEIGKGVEALDLEELACDLAYTIDGSDINTIDTENFSASTATVNIKGHNVHPGYAKGIMVNALQIATEFVMGIPLAERPSRVDDLLGYYHPCKIEGDVSLAQVVVLLRDFEEDGMHQRKQFLEELCANLKKQHPEAEIDLEIKDSYKNMGHFIKKADPRVVDFLFETGKALGLELKATRIRGGTDGSRLSELGLPTPNIFTGGRQFHSVYEWNTVQNLEKAKDFVYNLMGYWSKNG